MDQENIIYDRAKENMRKYWRIDGISINKRVIYESAILQYLMKEEYREDTRIYSIAQSIYKEKREKIFRLQNKIKRNEECCVEAVESCKDTLKYIELVIKPRINMRAIA